MIFKDYYKILGLETNRVSDVQIKNAYREQAKKYHPDVNIGNKNYEERFKDINEAYRVLSNNISKRKYDRMWNRNVGRIGDSISPNLQLSSLHEHSRIYQIDVYRMRTRHCSQPKRDTCLSGLDLPGSLHQCAFRRRFADLSAEG